MVITVSNKCTMVFLSLVIFLRTMLDTAHSTRLVPTGPWMVLPVQNHNLEEWCGTLRPQPDTLAQVSNQNIF